MDIYNSIQSGFVDRVTMLFAIFLMVTVVSAWEYDSQSKWQDPGWQDNTNGGLTENTRAKRFIANIQVKNNDGDQACILPDGKKGTCRPLRQGMQDEYRINFFKFLEHACIINCASIGICGPETGKRGGQQGLAGDLPAIVPQDENNDLTLKIPVESRGCGLNTRSQSQLQVVTDPREWPWMASILESQAQPKLHCGGAVITERHVLTAAHCVDESYEPLKFIVRLGEYDFKRTNDTRSATFDVWEVRIHEEYQATNHKNDIAILKLNRSCLFNTYVWPICLPPSNLDLAGKDTTLIGWGTNNFGGKTSHVLQEVAVPVWTSSACHNAHVNSVFDENICAGALKRDACQLDSGSPLMYQSAGGRWMLVGIVSWGMRCGEREHPGIYTRVDKYIPWIQRNSGL